MVSDHDILFTGLASWLFTRSISWETAQELAFVLLALICLGACVWSARTGVSATQRATAEAKAYGRRIKALVLAHDERLLAALNVELERSRTAYHRTGQEQWEHLVTELGKGFDRLEQHVARAEEHLVLEHDQSVTRLNEAMVIIQQAGLAAARAVSSRTGPDTRFRA